MKKKKMKRLCEYDGLAHEKIIGVTPPWPAPGQACGGSYVGAVSNREEHLNWLNKPTMGAALKIFELGKLLKRFWKKLKRLYHNLNLSP